MKHLKKFENDKNEDINEYYVYVNIDRLLSLLNLFKVNDIEYSLHILKNNEQIALFSIFKANRKNLYKINGLGIYTKSSINLYDIISNIRNKCEDVTKLSFSEIKKIFDIFEQSKKYNL